MSHPTLPSRLRHSTLPPDDDKDPLDLEIADEVSESESTSTQEESQPGPTFSLQVFPSSAQPAVTGSQDHLPLLLGLDTLSLSLPSASASQTSSRKTPKQKPISKIVIRNIPAWSIHLLFASPRLDTGMRSGFWLSFSGVQSDQMVSVRWDAEREEVLPVEEDLDDVHDQGVKTFDYQHLLALKASAGTKLELENDGETVDAQHSRQDGDDEWQLLTTHISPEQLRRILPSIVPLHSRYQIWPISTLTSTPSDTHSSMSNSITTPSEPVITFTQISFTRTFPPSAIGSERTKWARDRSWYLDTILSFSTPSTTSPLSTYGAALLAELQLSFLLTIILGNYPCLQQWKSLLALTLTCRVALLDPIKKTFFTSFLDILATQLKYLASDHKSESSAAVENNTTTASNEDATSSIPTDTGVPIEIHGTDGDEIARLLRTFGLSIEETFSDQDLSSPERDSLTTVARAFGTLSVTVEKMGLHWSLPSSLISLSSSTIGKESSSLTNDRPANGLARRLLRIREGFGDDADGNSDEEDDEEGEFAPVVVDLDGAFAAQGESDESEGEEEIDEDDGMELEDPRY